MTIGIITEQAKAHYRINGSWPTCKSGPIVDAPGETWARVENALYMGLRGLPLGISLSRILHEEKQRAATFLIRLSCKQLQLHMLQAGRIF